MITETTLMSTVPDEIRESIDRYVTHGVKPGSFVQAVLANDFVQAACMADDGNVRLLRQIAQYVYNEVPRGVWGSWDAVKAHLEKKRNETSDS